MKLIGLMPVRNEDWVLGLSARAALMWCDELVVLDHACADLSWELLCGVHKESGGRCPVMATRTGLTWTEMSHRQALLTNARLRGATHIALIDADEVLTGNLLQRIRFMIEVLPEQTVLQLPWLALPRSVDRYLTEGIWGENYVSSAFKDSPAMGWKLPPDGYDFHHRQPYVIKPGGDSEPLGFCPWNTDGGLMHLQFLSERRLRAKQALYQMTEVLRWPGRKSPAELAHMYGRAVYESDPLGFANAPVPASWWEPYRHLMKHLDIDKEPWQEAEVRRLIAEHGRERFSGLDLFGVDK